MCYAAVHVRRSLSLPNKSHVTIWRVGLLKNQKGAGV
jgi:hypothetical protein